MLSPKQTVPQLEFEMADGKFCFRRLRVPDWISKYVILKQKLVEVLHLFLFHFTLYVFHLHQFLFFYLFTILLVDLFEFFSCLLRSDPFNFHMSKACLSLCDSVPESYIQTCLFLSITLYLALSVQIKNLYFLASSLFNLCALSNPFTSTLVRKSCLHV